jgi:Spy/CpxP family protein refolding chaperone
MKNLKIKMLALVAALALAASFNVQAEPPADAPKDGGPHHHHGGPGEHWMKMAKDLNLTDDQKEKIKDILKTKFKETKEEIEGVLTAEQRVKLEEKKAEWKAKRGDHKCPKPADAPAK